MMLHYLGNSGSAYRIDLGAFIDKLDYGKKALSREIREALAFVEHNRTFMKDEGSSIYSREVSTGETDSTSSDYSYSIGKFQVWGKGKARVCGDTILLNYEFKLFDRYNFNRGQSTFFDVPLIGQQEVPDEVPGHLHEVGLAREFDVEGAVHMIVKSKRGQEPEIIHNGALVW
jgi:hypothetical protein